MIFQKLGENNCELKHKDNNGVSHVSDDDIMNEA